MHNQKPTILLIFISVLVLVVMFIGVNTFIQPGSAQAYVPTRSATAKPSSTPSLRPSGTRIVTPTLPFYLSIVFNPDISRSPTPTSSITYTATPPYSKTPTRTHPPYGTPTATPSGEGFSDVDAHIVNIYWSGDPARNQSNEYIELQNLGIEPFDLGGWSVYAEDVGLDVYFPTGFTLASDAFCRVYTNEVHADSCGGVSFQSDEELWPDDVTGCGTLWDGDENLVADYCY